MVGHGYNYSAALWSRRRSAHGETACDSQVFTEEDAAAYGQTLDWLAVAVANQEANVIAEAYYTKKLLDKDNVAAYLLRDSGVPRYNPLILAPAEPPRRLALAGAKFSSGPAAAALRYLHAAGTDDDTKAITHWVVADLGAAEGRALALAAVRFLSAAEGGAGEGTRSRVAIIGSGAPSGLGALLQAAAAVPSRRKALLPFLESVLADPLSVAAKAADGRADAVATDVDAAEAAAAAAGLRPGAIAEALAPPQQAALAAQQAALTALAVEALGLAPGGAAVVTNGRVTELSSAQAEAFQAADFALLEALEWRDRAAAVAAVARGPSRTSQHWPGPLSRPPDAKA